MLPMTTTEYADVFMPLTYSPESGNLMMAMAGIFFFATITLGLWLMGGMPGFPDLKYKTHERFANGFVATLVLFVAGFVVCSSIAVVHSFTNVSESNAIRDAMKENVEKKYGAELLPPYELPEMEDRAKDHIVSLVFEDVPGNETSVQQTYKIRYDRITNEPFISEVGTPTAEELAQAADK